MDIPFTASHLASTAHEALGRADPRQALSRLLAHRFHADAAILFSSGTSALGAAISLGLAEAGRGPLALPAYTCFDVATAARESEVALLFFDVDPDTLAPDPDSFREALRRGARVVVVSSLFGFPIGWHGIHSRVGDHGAILIEDAAQGHGAYEGGRPHGSLGDLSVLSFGRGKGWTGGRGGALLLRGPPAKAADRIRDLRDTGRIAEARLWLELTAWWVLGRPSLYWMPAAVPRLRLGKTTFRHPRPGSAMSRLSAALVLRTRAHAAAAVWERRRMGHMWRRSIPEGSMVRHLRPLGASAPGHLRFPLRLTLGLEGFADSGEGERLGIARSYPMPLYALPAIRARALHPVAACPGAEELARTLVTLPNHGLLSPREVDRIVSLLAEYGG